MKLSPEVKKEIDEFEKSFLICNTIGFKKRICKILEAQIKNDYELAKDGLQYPGQNLAIRDLLYAQLEDEEKECDHVGMYMGAVDGRTVFKCNFCPHCGEKLK